MNDFDKKKHETEMGQKAEVQRGQYQSSEFARANGELRKIGEFLGKETFLNDAPKYVGSAAVHVYKTEMLGQIFFMTQTDTLQGVAESTAADAVSALRKDSARAFGRELGKKRSGF